MAVGTQGRMASTEPPGPPGPDLEVPPWWMPFARPILAVDRWLTRQSEALQSRCRRHPVGWIAALRVGVYIVLVALLLATKRAPMLVWVMAVVAVVLSIVVGRLLPLSQLLQVEQPGHTSRLALTGLGVLFALAGVVGYLLVPSLRLNLGGELLDSAWSFAAIATLSLGLGLLIRVQRACFGSGATDHGFRRLGRILFWTELVLGWALFVTGLFLMRRSPYGIGAVLAVVGLVLFPFFVTQATEAVHHWAERPRVSLPFWSLVTGPQALGDLAKVGLGLVVVSTLLVRFWLRFTWGLTIGAALALLLVLFLISMRGDMDVLLWVIAFAAAYGFASTTVPAVGSAELTVLPGQRYFIAIGDSYMSGEGTGAFYEGTNSRRLNECRRSPKSYTALLAGKRGEWVEGTAPAAFPDHVLYFACSGAVVKHLWYEPQYTNQPIGGPARLQSDGTFRRGAPQLIDLTERRQLLGQLAQPGDSTSPDFVLLSIGGNDSGFGSIARSCILPGDCSTLQPLWIKVFEPTGQPVLLTRLIEAYSRVRDEVGADIPIVVVPYPNPVAGETGPNCSGMTPTERSFLHTFTDQLNITIGAAVTARQASGDTRIAVAEPVATSFERDGGQLCSPSGKRSDVNLLLLGPTGGLLRQNINPLTWVHNSMHPTKRGHEAVAKDLSAWLGAHLGEMRQGTVLPPSTDVERFVAEDYRADPGSTYCDPSTKAPRTDLTDFVSSCAARWQVEQVSRFIWQVKLVPLLTLGFGWWLIVIWAIQRVRRAFDSERVHPAPAPIARV